MLGRWWTGDTLVLIQLAPALKELWSCLCSFVHQLWLYFSYLWLLMNLDFALLSLLLYLACFAAVNSGEELRWRTTPFYVLFFFTLSLCFILNLHRTFWLFFFVLVIQSAKTDLNVEQVVFSMALDIKEKLSETYSNLEVCFKHTLV